MTDFKKVKEFLEKIDKSQIFFKKHFRRRTHERPISEEMVRKHIKNTQKLLNVEKQPSKIKNQKKYKIWLKLSSKYSLVLIIAIAQKGLYIITGWNTDRKWQKSMQK